MKWGRNTLCLLLSLLKCCLLKCIQFLIYILCLCLFSLSLSQTLSFAQRHLELVTKEVYLGHSSAERHSREPGAGVTGSQEKQYGLVTKKDRYVSS